MKGFRRVRTKYQSAQESRTFPHNARFAGSITNISTCEYDIVGDLPSQSVVCLPLGVINHLETRWGLGCAWTIHSNFIEGIEAELHVIRQFHTITYIKDIENFDMQFKPVPGNNNTS